MFENLEKVIILIAFFCKRNVRMYVCMYVCLYACVCRVCVCVFVCVCMYVCIYVCIYVLILLHDVTRYCVHFTDKVYCNEINLTPTVMWTYLVDCWVEEGASIFT